MNKQDIILIISVILIGFILFIIINYIYNDTASKAYVYYDNKLIKTIDLSTDKLQEYIVKGYNGDVVIQTQKNKIRVKEEESPYHICSKQGWVTSSLEPIVCLPNKIVIKIASSSEEIDAVLR